MSDRPHLLTDIALEPQHHELRPVYREQTERRSVATLSRVVEDFRLTDGLDNLGQAVVLRLLTPRGELAPLGHPAYGSRLHELIGDLNTETHLNLMRLYIVESLDQEPRIEKVEQVDVQADPFQRSQVRVTLTVKAVGEVNLVTIGPFTLTF